MIPGKPRDLSRAFQAAAEEAVRLSKVDDASDLGAYHIQVSRVMGDLKRCSVELAVSGHQDGLLLLSSLSKQLMDCLKASQPDALKEILVGVLSDQFPLNSAQVELLSTMSLPPYLLVKAFKQALTQESKPGDTLCAQLKLLPPGRFMECWLLVVAEMVPAPIAIDPDKIHKPLQSLHRHLNDRNHIQAAAEVFAAHMEQLRPILRYLIDHSTVQALSLVKGGAEEQVAPSGSVTIGHVTRFRHALGFSGEFLFNLYAVTQDPIVLEVAEVAIHQPSGYWPYDFYERLGLGRSREWHLEQQIKSNGIKLVRLYEHAICTDGLDIDVAKVRRDKAIAANPEVRDLYLKVLRTIPLEMRGAKRKAQQLIDAFVDHCQIHEDDRLKRAFIEGGLPPILFAKHNHWLGKQFINELGV